MTDIFRRRSLLGAAAWLLNAASSPAANSNELDLSRRVMTLDATFDRTPDFIVGHADPLKPGETPPPLNDPAFRWRAGYLQTKLFRTITQPPWIPRGEPYPGFAWINHELAAFPNGDAIRSLGLDVVKVENRELVLSAALASAATRAVIPEFMNTPYVAGAVNSFPYAQTYGYFEMEAKLPKGPGVWPAFWLLPSDNTWPPEIDIVEILGRDPSTLHVSLHFPRNAAGKDQTTKPVRIPDSSAGYHRYGVDWNGESVSWYFDRKLVHSERTPASLINRPCYIVADVTIGNARSWGGGPDKSTVFPAEMRIRAIRAWGEK